MFDAFEAMQEVTRAQHPDAFKKKEAERAVEKEGRGVCELCGDEIIKNDSLAGTPWIWESESLLGFCDKALTGGKHKPRVVYAPEGGVESAQAK